MKVGHAFSDHIHTEKKYFFDRKNGYGEKKAHMRGFLLPIFTILVCIFLLLRLFSLQILDGLHYRSLSDTNRFRTTVIHAPRGIIFDRNGKPLVLNTPGFRETVNGKTKIISREDAIGLMVKGDTHLEVDSLRNYLEKDAAAHVIGYIGQVTADDLNKPSLSGYKSGDLIGRMGIESFYEDKLRGQDGKKLTEVDAMGKVIRTMGQTDPIPGENITLTLDASLQEKVYQAMQGVKKGAAIVTSPNGEVLAMISKPSFDPNLFTLGKTYAPSPGSVYTNVSQVVTDNQGQPLLDRAISGTYPPGSTFKVVAAAAALESHTIDSSFTVDDTGILKVGNFSFANWYFTQYGKTEGTVDVVKAIKRSNDIFFYKIGETLGVDKLSAGAEDFGLGARMGIDLPGESRGLVPTKEWKKKTFGEDWFLGDDYHYGIGQGYLLTTPLQVNGWTQAIANGGTLYEPHLLKDQEARIKKQGLLTEKNFGLIREGMIEACSPGGVAWPLFNFAVKNPQLKIDNKDITQVASDSAVASRSSDYRHVVVACKTGTAQHGGEDTLPHAWITLFAPAYHPQVIVTVLSEDSGEGSNVAGPIAKDILTAWFER